MNKILKFTLIGFCWIVIWYIGSLIIDLPLLFPAPNAVFSRLGTLLQTESFYKIALVSFVRILFGIVLAVGIGSLLAFISAIFKPFYDFLTPLIVVIKSTPVVAFVFLVNMIIGNGNTVIFICFLMVFPIIYSNVYQGIKSTDKDLLEMCKVYKLPLGKRITGLYLPSIAPYFVSSLLSSIGLAWKAGVAAEILCTPTISIGYEIFNAKTYIEFVDLFAWVITVVILSLIFELIATSSLNRLMKSKKLSKGANL